MSVCCSICHHLLVNSDTLVKPFEVLNVVDYGDAPVDPWSLDNSIGPIRALVREIAETGAVPIILGGDHTLDASRRCRLSPTSTGRATWA